MTNRADDRDWRQFEQLVARIDTHGLQVTSPDRIRCKTTGRLREVDASIRKQVNGIEALVTIECRRRTKRADVTWIEQLATKKLSIGASRTIAVSSSGFSSLAESIAKAHGIDLRHLTDISTEEINDFFAP